MKNRFSGVKHSHNRIFIYIFISLILLVLSLVGSRLCRAGSAKMSMSIKFRVNKAHEKNILAIAYNIHRREIYTASEETAIKVWEADTGKYVGSLQGHLGWVTALLYWYTFASSLCVLTEKKR